MAKRRNPKKEKALRNQEYARRFRKRTNTGRFGRRRYGDNDRTDNANNNQNEDDEENTGDSSGRR